MNNSGYSDIQTGTGGNAFISKFKFHIRNESYISELDPPGSLAQTAFSCEFSASNNVTSAMAEAPLDITPKGKIISEDSSEVATHARRKELRILEDIYLCGNAEYKRKAKQKERKNVMMVEIAITSPFSGV